MPSRIDRAWPDLEHCTRCQLRFEARSLAAREPLCCVVCGEPVKDFAAPRGAIDDRSTGPIDGGGEEVNCPS